MEPGTMNVNWSGLNHAPVLRWIAYLKNRSSETSPCAYDPIDMPETMPAERRLDGVLHFGFVVWNGKRFVLKQRASRIEWTDLGCDPRRTTNGCEGIAERSRPLDPFMDD